MSGVEFYAVESIGESVLVALVLDRQEVTRFRVTLAQWSAFVGYAAIGGTYVTRLVGPGGV